MRNVNAAKRRQPHDEIVWSGRKRRIEIEGERRANGRLLNESQACRPLPSRRLQRRSPSRCKHLANLGIQTSERPASASRLPRRLQTKHCLAAATLKSAGCARLALVKRLTDLSAFSRLSIDLNSLATAALVLLLREQTKCREGRRATSQSNSSTSPPIVNPFESRKLA